MEGEYTFFNKLAKALYDYKSSQPGGASGTVVQDDGRRETIFKCLLESKARWQKSTAEYRGYRGQTPPVEGIKAIVHTCLAVQDLRSCDLLLSSLLDLPPTTDIAAKFRDFYQPLVPALKAALHEHGVQVTSQPFRAFFKGVVSLYLERILGGVESPPPLPRIELRYISDEGKPGQQFHAFVNSPDRGPVQISGISQDRLYWFTETSVAKTVPVTVTAALTDRLRKTYTLTLEKKPEALIPYTWESRLAAAGVFLDSVADGEGMAVIMGERYGDMKDALDGKRAFVGIGNASAPTA